MIQASPRPYGIIDAGGYYETDATKNVPAFVISRPQYARIQRLLGRKIPVKLNLDLKTKFHSETTGYNVIAEIPGTDPKLKNEVVLIGGHFDSWHGGTGAVDNGAGSIVMLRSDAHFANDWSKTKTDHSYCALVRRRTGLFWFVKLCEK